uniref:Uncharacterized protein n=1 Tax=Tetranychus urticae TaxID=32264 RepID=T1K590_TETUR
MDLMTGLNIGIHLGMNYLTISIHGIIIELKIINTFDTNKVNQVE